MDTKSRKGKAWTAKEERVLLECVEAGFNHKDTGELLGRSSTAVQVQLSKMRKRFEVIQKHSKPQIELDLAPGKIVDKPTPVQLDDLSGVPKGDFFDRVSIAFIMGGAVGATVGFIIALVTLTY